MRYVMVMLVLPFALIAAGCAEERDHAAPVKPAAVTIPDLTGNDLDFAEEELDRLGIAYSVDSGDDEVLVEHLWTVCSQHPAAGTRARFVTLTVEHSCYAD
jgi:PASTA domain-containing protein